MNLGMAREKLGDGGRGARPPQRPRAGRRRPPGRQGRARRAARPGPRASTRRCSTTAWPTRSPRSPRDSAIPVELTADIPDRPTPAIETIAYFCAAELLANAAKHSYADKIAHPGGRTATDVLLLSGHRRRQRRGRPGPRHRPVRARRSGSRTVDGRLDIASPPGGPTRSPSSCRCAHEADGSTAMRVVIAEDAALLRDGLTRLLDRPRPRGVRRRGRRRRAARRGGRAPARRRGGRHPDAADATPTRGCAPPSSSAATTRRTGVLVFSQYIETRYTARLLATAGGAAASATCSRTGSPTWPSSPTR